MATRTKPLVSAATLASAAAVAAAGVVIAPSLNLPSPHALTAAKVQLATFADVLTIPAVEWTDLLFGNTSWGGVLTPTNYGDAAAAPQDVFGQHGYVNPWATYCDGSCTVNGVTGAAYLFFDALVNGNGEGYDNVNKWNTSFVNYYFEPNSQFLIGGGSSPTVQFVAEGNSAVTWYLLQTTLGKAIPALTIPMSAAFWGPTNVSVFYNLGLSVVAALVGQVPVIGPFTGNSILAYLGDLEIPNSGGAFYQYGLSGALNYWVDIATGAVPFPTSLGSAAATRAAAASVRAAETTAAPAAAAAAVTAPETPAVSNDAKPESTPAAKAPESTPAADVVDNTPASKAPESTPAVTAPESTPAVEAPESTPAAEAPASTPAAEAPASTSAPEAPASTPAADTAPAKPTRAHPVRDAVEKVGKQISDALNGAKSKAGAAKAGAASRGSDSAS